MKAFSFKNILPHLVAIGIFLLVSVIFCKPALESGVVLQQSDVTAVESMKHQSELYRQTHGVYPLWVTSMFSGMPAFNIIFDGPVSPFQYVSKALQLWLPKPLNFFFLCSICFYIFCMCVRIRPWVAIFASLAYAYSTYNPILVVAGHDTKLLAMAYAPALLGSIILLFEKQYIKGFVFSALFATLHLQQNHQQITYYLFLIVVLMSLAYLVRWIRAGEFAHIGKAGALALGSALIGVLINAVLILPVYDYAKDSKRGGQLVIPRKDAAATNGQAGAKTEGLSKEYAFQWSNDKVEGLTLLFPGIRGYGTYFSQRDQEYNIFPKLDEKSAVYTYLTEKLNLPENNAEQFAANLSGSIYWGDKPFTSGPAYVGAVICCLFILGMFLMDNRHKWWMLAASVLGILLAMGKNLPAFNNFLFDHLPFYNKFRTPEMALVIPQFLFPMLAAMTVNKLVEGGIPDAERRFRWGAIALGGIFLAATLMYFSFDYSKENRERMREAASVYTAGDANAAEKLQALNGKYESLTDNRVYEQLLYQTKGDSKVAREVLTALRSDRKSFFGGDILKAFLLTLGTLALVALYLRKKAGSTVLLAGLSLLVLIDLLPMGMHYVNAKSFETAENYAANEFTESEADKIILADKDPNYRVFDISGGDPFQDARPSYFHKSIGGYHPAKIGIYDDLASYHLSGRPNPAVLNMLNTKYIIQRTPDGNNKAAYPNPGALGNCWWVKGVQWVKGPVEEMQAMEAFNPRDTAIMEEQYRQQAGNFTAADSSASIRQTSFDNMAIRYESQASGTHMAVFSEVFYRDWKAYIDGKEVPVLRANYVLRALVIPAGKHTIDFKFEPRVFNTSYQVSLWANWLLVAILAAFAWYSWRKKSPSTES